MQRSHVLFSDRAAGGANGPHLKRSWKARPTGGLQGGRYVLDQTPYGGVVLAESLPILRSSLLHLYCRRKGLGAEGQHTVLHHHVEQPSLRTTTPEECGAHHHFPVLVNKTWQIRASDVSSGQHYSNANR